jgi:hypothetical protein
MNSNFLIGQFVPRDSGITSTAGNLSSAGHYVLLVEDYRTGARPVKPADFRQLKGALKQEIGEGEISGEDEKRLCFNTRPSVGNADNSQHAEPPRYMTTEFVNVKGRVAIIYAVVVGGTAENSRLAKRSADTRSGCSRASNVSPASTTGGAPRLTSSDRCIQCNH